MGGAEALGMPDAWAPDRRRASRRLVPFVLRVRVEGEDHPIRVRELSAAGMVVETARPLTAGDSIVFELGDADAAGPIHGHVVHSRLMLSVRVGGHPTCLAGVAFQHVTPAQASRLALVLAEIDRQHAGHSQDVP